MFAELAAVTSALGAINSTISTFKEAQANASDVSGLIAKFGSASEKLNEWERKKKLKRPLSTKEAMDLTLARRQIAQTERQLKDICLMAGCGDVWNEAQRIREQSERDQKQFLKDINLKRKKRKERTQAIFIGVFLFAAMNFIAWGSYQLYSAIKQANAEAAKTRIEKRREELRNIRQCGRKKC